MQCAAILLRCPVLELLADLFASEARNSLGLWFRSVKPSRATVHRTVAFTSSNLYPLIKKSAIPDGMTDFLELLARFELATSSLPRVEGLRPSWGRSTADEIPLIYLCFHRSVVTERFFYVMPERIPLVKLLYTDSEEKARCINNVEHLLWYIGIFE